MISKGQEIKPIKLPDFTGKHIMDVIPELDKLGLLYQIENVTDSKLASGTVIKTDPKADTEIKVGNEDTEGTKITIYVSFKDEEQTTVPDETTTTPPVTDTPAETTTGKNDETTAKTPEETTGKSDVTTSKEPAGSP